MRKFLVVLLVLSIMGGAFAQDEETANKWGALSGAAGLSSRLHFGGHDDNGRSADQDSRMDGTNTDVWLKMTYTNTIGPWAISVPLALESGFFGVKGGEVSYTGFENLTLSMGFGFELSSNYDDNRMQKEALGLALGIVPLSHNYYANASAVYAADTYGFTLGVDNIVGTWNAGDKNNDNKIGLGAVGGYYHFMDAKSQLYVSLNGAYETKWWRASDRVLTSRFVNDNISWVQKKKETAWEKKWDDDEIYKVNDYDKPISWDYGKWDWDDGNDNGSGKGLANPKEEVYGYMIFDQLYRTNLKAKQHGDYNFLNGAEEWMRYIGISKERDARVKELTGYDVYGNGNGEGLISDAWETFNKSGKDADKAAAEKLEEEYANITEYDLIKGDVGFDFYEENYAHRYSDFDNKSRFYKPRALDFHWENIADNGIAYRFFVVPEQLSLGIAFAPSDDRLPPFTSNRDDGNFQDGQKDFFLEDFFLNPVFGIGYDNKDLLDGLSVSTMIGLKPVTYRSGALLGKGPTEGKREVDVYWALGANVGIIEGLTAGFDLSSMFYGTKDYDDSSMTPIFNIGFGLDLDKPINDDLSLAANAGFKIYDMALADIFAFGLDLGAGFGYTLANGKFSADASFSFYSFSNSNVFADIDAEDKKDYFAKEDEKNAYAAGIYDYKKISEFNEAKVSSMDMGFNLGFTGFKLGGDEQFTLGVTTGITVNILKISDGFFDFIYNEVGEINTWGTPDKSKVDISNTDPSKHVYYNKYYKDSLDETWKSTKTVFGWSISPTLDWAVHANGTISFGYTFGIEIDSSVAKDERNAINKNDVTVAFKWSL